MSKYSLTCKICSKYYVTQYEYQNAEFLKLNNSNFMSTDKITNNIKTYKKKRLLGKKYFF